MVKLFQQAGAKTEVSDFVVGTQGTAEVMRHVIRGKMPYTHRKDPRDDMYQNEHDELFASIRSGKHINDGDWMARSTLLAIMGRMATYTGQEITWEMAMNSKEDLTPAKMEFGPLAVAPVARPGITKFI